MLTNGDFEQVNIHHDYSILSNFLGWEVWDGEVGVGSFYNKRWGKTKVIELDARQNTAYTSRVNLRAGRYEINFEWAAR